MDYVQEAKVYAHKLKEAKPYVDYHKYKKVMKSNPQLLEQVNDYRRQCFQIQIEHGEGSYESYEHLLKLNESYGGLMEMEEVKRFLEAETRLSEMITEVYDTIAEEMEIDITFLDEE